MSRAYARYVELLVRRPKSVILATLLVTSVLVYHALFLRIRFDPDGNFPPGHPYVQIDKKVRKYFGGWNYVLMIVKATHGDVWNPGVLSVVHDLTEEARLLPGLMPNTLVSLSSPNVRVVEERRGALNIDYLMREVPRDPGEIAALRAKVLSQRLLREGLISADETATIVSADFEDSVSADKITAGLRTLARRHTTDDVEIYVTGGPVLIHAYNSYVFRVWQRFVLAFAIIAGILFLSFGTLQGMIIPLCSGRLSTLWALGVMGGAGSEVDQ